MKFPSISKLKDLLKKGEVTGLELYERSILQMKRTERLNAFITKNINYDDQNINYDPKKPLSGIPFAVKDNFCTNNLRTTCASKMLDNFIPPYDATVVQKLLDAGAVLVGKTNMDEFAMGSGSVDSFYGPVRNPWSVQTDSVEGDEWHIAGGSSGGSAVAVATGVCPFALGSDTGGSVRNPAAYCGVVGLKPTYGLLSRHGLIPLVNSMDVPGILSQTVEDAQIVFNILQGHDPMDSTTYYLSNSQLQCKTPDHLTVGVPEGFEVSGLSEEVKVLWDECISYLQNLGAKVKRV